MNKYFTRGLLAFFTFFIFLIFGSFILNSVEARTLPTPPSSPRTYALTFDPGIDENGKVISLSVMNPVNLPPGRKITLPSCDFTNDKHKFIGWALTPDGPVNFEQWDDFTMGNKKVTLYAKWSLYYMIYFDANGGSDMDGAETNWSGLNRLNVMPGIPCKLLNDTNVINVISNIPEYGGPQKFGIQKKGSEFAGWSETINGPVVYNGGESCPPYTANSPAYITLYASWTELGVYYLTFKPMADDVTGSMPDKPVIDGEPEALPLNQFKREGFEFLGWDSTCYNFPNSLFVNFPDGAMWGERSTERGHDQSFCAKWKPADQITFNPNWPDPSHPGDGTMLPLPITPKKSVNLPNVGFDQIGSDFEGWATTPTGRISYRDGQLYTPGRTVKSFTLYAIWTPSPYHTVTFDKNDLLAIGSMPSVPLYDNANDYLPLNLGQITKVGYKFDGWTTNPDGTGTYYADGGLFVMRRANVTLYAKWVASYTITFNPNEGTGSAYVQTLPTGISTTLVSNTFTRDAYRFIGWATSTTGSVVYSENASYLGSADANLYAVWAPPGATVITFDPNWPGEGTGIWRRQVGTGSMPPQVIPAGSTSTRLTPNAFHPAQVCDGGECWNAYGFTGWMTSTSYTPGGRSYYNTEVYILTGEPSVTLYASWYPLGAVAPDTHTYASSLISWDLILKLIKALR